MKVALTFLTLTVVLLLGSLMWGMKTYTDLAHAKADVEALRQQLDVLGGGAGSISAALPGTAAPMQARPRQQAAAGSGAGTPALSEAEIEARLEEMIASRLGQQEQKIAEKEAKISDMEAELRAYELESASIDDERASLQAERERIAPTSLTEDQNKIATAPSLAKVTEANAQYSFVVMDAGENKNLTVGARFSIRREHMIIGEVVIDTVEPREAVGNVVPTSVPAGVVVKPGDEIVELIGIASS